MEAFNDRVARAFGALGGAGQASGHQAPIQTAHVRTDSTDAKTLADTPQIVADWPLASSRGFGALSKRKAEVAKTGVKDTLAAPLLWSVAQEVERKKRMREEIESSDDEEFEKKKRVGGSSDGVPEGGEDGDADEGELISYVPLTEVPENDEEEGEWVRQMVGLDETLDNEEEEDGYDRMAAPTGADPLGRMHTSRIGDADEPLPKHGGLFRRDLRANRDAAAARLQEDDEELERAGRGEEKETLEVPLGQPMLVEPQEKKGGEVGEVLGGNGDEALEVLPGEPTSMEPLQGIEKTDGGNEGPEKGKRRRGDDTKTSQEDLGRKSVEFPEAPFEIEESFLQIEAEKEGDNSGANEPSVGRAEGGFAFKPMDQSRFAVEPRLRKNNGSVQNEIGSEPVPDEEPLSFPNHRSGFLSKSSEALPGPGALKRPAEQTVKDGDENRVKKRVRFTEEVTERDEQRERNQKAEGNSSRLFNGAQWEFERGGSLEGFQGGVKRKVGNGEQYVPPHRRTGFVQKASRVPDHVKHPENYTVYTLEWSDDEDEKFSEKGVADEAKNEGAFLEAVGRLKGELGNIRFEEISEKRQENPDPDGSVAGQLEAADGVATDGPRPQVAVRFVQRKKEVNGQNLQEGGGSKEGENGAPVSRPKVTVAASAEGLTRSAFDNEEEGDEKDTAVRESDGRPQVFRKRGNESRPNKRYRVRSADEDG